MEPNQNVLPTEHRSADMLHFAVDAALLFELGEQLVARRSIALAELIKNAYDADATKVTVTFYKVTEAGGTIVIADDGLGMTFETLRDTWMRIATANKKQQPYSTLYKRLRTGAKGVGRFAVRKLSRQLSLRTVAKVNEAAWEEVTIRIDWDRYTPGFDLEQVGAEYHRFVSTEPLPTGVTLELTSLRDVWVEEDLKQVRRDLEDLMPPFAAPTQVQSTGSTGEVISPDNQNRQELPTHDDPGFLMWLVAPEFPILEGNLSEQFLSAATSKLTGVINKAGKAEYRVKFRGEAAEDEFQPPEARFGTLCGATFTVHYFVYESQSLAGSDLGLREARRLGRRFGGVKIYLDQFRVFPYGDPGDDWLDLDSDRAGRRHGVDAVLRNLMPSEDKSRPLLNLPGNNQLFGAVYVSRVAHPGLQLNISRERLLENDAFQQLKSFVRLGLDWMTIQRAAFDRRIAQRQLGTTGRDPVPQTTTQVVENTVRSIGEQLETIRDLPVAVAIAQELAGLSDTVHILEEEQIGKLAMLRVLASAGTTVVIFAHQMRSILDGLRRLTREFGDIGSEIDPQFVGNIDGIRSRLATWQRMMEAQATQLGLLLGEDARLRRRSLVVRPIVDQVKGTFEFYCQRHGIEIRNEVPLGVRTPPLYEAELHSLLLNLMTNALKAVKEQPTRNIAVSAQQNAHQFRLKVCDTGIGIATRDWGRVFEPFVTTSLSDPILGVGTGLGLTIVRDIVSEHGGTVSFIDPEPPWNTCIALMISHGIEN